MILLDTNVISEAMKPEPHPSVRNWLDAQAAETVFLSSVTIAELLFGIGALPRGKRKDRLAAALDGMLDLFTARIRPSIPPRQGAMPISSSTPARPEKASPRPIWLHRRDRRRARVRRSIARHQCVQCCRSGDNRSLDRAQLIEVSSARVTVPAEKARNC